MIGPGAAVLRKRIEALEARRSGAGGIRVLICPHPMSPDEYARWEAENVGPQRAQMLNVIVRRLSGE